MPVLSYKAWLQKTGKKPTAAAAREWDRMYNGGKRFSPKPQPETTMPTFDFNGPLDEQGEADRTTLDFRNKGQQSAIDTDYNSGIAELDAQEKLLGQDRDRGILGVDRNAAARGVVRSGIRETNRGDVLANYLTGAQGIARSRTNLANRRQGDMDRLNADYQQDMNNIRTGSIGRRWQRWRDEQGGL